MNRDELIDKLQKRRKVETRAALLKSKQFCVTSPVLSEKMKKLVLYLSNWINPPCSPYYKQLISCETEQEVTLFGVQDSDVYRQELYEALLKELDEHKKMFYQI